MASSGNSTTGRSLSLCASASLAEDLGSILAVKYARRHSSPEDFLTVETRVRKILARLGGNLSQGAVITRLSGGITNHNFRVVVGERDLVVRVGGGGTELLGIDRRNEGKTALLAASAGISAAILLSDPDEGILVSEFIKGETLTPEAARRPEVFARVIAAIRTIHESPAFPGNFCPFATVRRYHGEALKRAVSFPSQTNRALEAMAQIEACLGSKRRSVPCHNDLLPGNFIDDAKKIWIIDWEYAGMGDLFFDLGNFAINLELPTEECSQIIDAYFGGPSPASLARLHLMRLASDLREAFWGFLQSAVSSLDFDFRAYGEKHLTRFFHNQTSGDFATWIKIVRSDSQL